MKVGFITTINTNIGDDFIRRGIENILNAIIGENNLEYTYVNKHKPKTAIIPNSLLGILYRTKNFKGRNRIIGWLERKYTHCCSIFKKQDIIIQSGAPVLWPRCDINTEWKDELWHNTIGKLYKRIPTLNLAAGSCYPLENFGEFYSETEKQYANTIGNYCRLTTTRDKLCYKLFTDAGIENVLFPCTAFFVSTTQFQSNPIQSNPIQSKYILINYMEGGGHYDWGQNIDKKQWENIIIYLIDNLKQAQKVCFICHDEKEVEAARKLNTGLDIFYPKTIEEYLNIAQYAKLGINNRVHASVAMGSLGIPTISIGTDTRLLMVENIGQTYYYVKNVEKEHLLSKSLELLRNTDKEYDQLMQLKKESFENYCNLIRKYLPKK